MFDFFSTPPGIALILSTVIFLIAIFLVIFRVIGFWLTLLFLLFSLLVGVIVGNFGVFKDYMQSRKSIEFQNQTDVKDNSHESDGETGSLEPEQHLPF